MTVPERQVVFAARTHSLQSFSRMFFGQLGWTAVDKPLLSGASDMQQLPQLVMIISDFRLALWRTQ